MRILFYGGCHAQVLHSIFTRYSDPENVYDLLINFHLIKSGRPFPWDLLKTCDAIVYSPVRHPDYNSQLIKEFCRENGKIAVTYPWIQWNGYFPGAKKVKFLEGVSWCYPNLKYAGEQESGFSKWIRNISDKAYGLEFIKENFVNSNNKLTNFEKNLIRIFEYLLLYLKIIARHVSFLLPIIRHMCCIVMWCPRSVAK